MSRRGLKVYKINPTGVYYGWTKVCCKKISLHLIGDLNSVFFSFKGQNYSHEEELRWFSLFLVFLPLHVLQWRCYLSQRHHSADVTEFNHSTAVDPASAHTQTHTHSASLKPYSGLNECQYLCERWALLQLLRLTSAVWNINSALQWHIDQSLCWYGRDHQDPKTLVCNGYF